MQLSMLTAVVTIIFANEFELDRQVSSEHGAGFDARSRPITLSVLDFYALRALFHRLIVSRMPSLMKLTVL